MIRRVISSMEAHRESVIKWIDALLAGQGRAEAYHSAVLSDAAHFVRGEDSDGER
ncbi:MAG: hypothetical protein IKU34_08425 [Clostridia bacterium]|nr:hypothetical protein [Clostridia bacterium]